MSLSAAVPFMRGLTGVAKMLGGPIGKALLGAKAAEYAGYVEPLLGLGADLLDAGEHPRQGVERFRRDVLRQDLAEVREDWKAEQDRLFGELPDIYE